MFLVGVFEIVLLLIGFWFGYTQLRQGRASQSQKIAEKFTHQEVATAAPAFKPISSAFESTVIIVPVKPGEGAIDVQWTYTNHWDFHLAVKKSDTSCGCL